MLDIPNSTIEWMDNRSEENYQLDLISSIPAYRLVEAPCLHHSDLSGELKREFLNTLSEAKESIECLTFSFSDPEILEILLQKASLGVTVTIVIDDDHRGFIAPYASKFNILSRHSGEGRIHHKITTIDGMTVWLGSANLSPDGLTQQNNTMLRLESRELAHAIHQEVEVFKGNRLRDREPMAPFIIGGQKVELLLFPHVPHGVLYSPEHTLNEYGKRRLIELIHSAQKNLRLAVSVWTDPDLAEAVILAHKRGVNVEVVLWKFSESPDIASRFKRAGIALVERPDLKLMHNKWMWVDDAYFFNGSANWSKSWFTRNDESGIILSHLNDSQKKFLSDYWNFLYR